MTQESCQATHSSGGLASFPVEVILEIFCYASSLSETLALSGTCRRLMVVFVGNARYIYTSIGPRVVERERDARKHRRDQMGVVDLPLCVMTAVDIYAICRGAKIVDKAITRVERLLSLDTHCTFCCNRAMRSNRRLPRMLMDPQVSITDFAVLNTLRSCQIKSARGSFERTINSLALRGLMSTW
jgi:hypothetical protein